MQNSPDIRLVQIAAPADEEVLSPESFVFVALMSVEEGPNKASFIAIAITDAPKEGEEQG